MKRIHSSRKCTICCKTFSKFVFVSVYGRIMNFSLNICIHNLRRKSHSGFSIKIRFYRIVIFFIYSFLSLPSFMNTVYKTQTSYKFLWKLNWLWTNENCKFMMNNCTTTKSYNSYSPSSHYVSYVFSLHFHRRQNALKTIQAQCTSFLFLSNGY